MMSSNAFAILPGDAAAEEPPETARRPQSLHVLPLRVVIVDDDLQTRATLRGILEVETGVEVVAEYGCAGTAFVEIPLLEPDAVFVNVDMPRSTGLAIPGRFHLLTHGPAMIVVSASEEYAVEAFEDGAIDYLLKPLSPGRIAMTIRRVRKRRRQAPIPSGPSPGAPVRGRVAVKTRDGMRILSFDEIDWVECADNYVSLHTGSSRFLHRETLSHLEEALCHAGFVRINRGTLVNLDRIVLIQPGIRRNHVVVLQNGVRLILHQAYRSRLRPFVAGLF